jgi:hypothetical protein
MVLAKFSWSVGVGNVGDGGSSEDLDLFEVVGFGDFCDRPLVSRESG